MYNEKPERITYGMENKMAEIIRKHITFYGYLQGVGFRFRARHAAENIGATGWVKNEYDGSVSMEIQGSQEQIDKVITAIEKGPFIHIENMEQQTIPIEPGEHYFITKG